MCAIKDNKTVKQR